MSKPKLIYHVGDIEIDVTPAEEDYEWVKLLFESNANPFKALRDMGFWPQDEMDFNE
jgi:hypothetical protein